MEVFNDQTFRRQAAVIILILLALFIVNQLTAIRISSDFKSRMIEHDYGVAGYLAEKGFDEREIILALTSGKTVSDKERGTALLSVSGYDESIKNSLMPEALDFQRNYQLITTVISILFSFIILTVLYRFALKRDHKYRKAETIIRRFLDGNTSLRLDDKNEDRLSRVFSAVNMMATSLTAHIEKESHQRQFLKDTISDISHQLKTPLAALEMYNTIIINENTKNEVVESFTSKISREISRMESLIQNLLKLAKLDAGTIELEIHSHNINDLLEQCLATFKTRVEEEEKHLILRCNSSLTLSFDSIWLREAVENIIKNALDHTGTGGRIELSCEETVVDTEITIKDNGAGIHPEDINYIFKRFYRSRYSKDRHGVGIGLPLAKAIIEKHGGTITVKSELGKGSIFQLIFPKLTDM